MSALLAVVALRFSTATSNESGVFLSNLLPSVVAP
jgi:hypothetical protein